VYAAGEWEIPRKKDVLISSGLEEMLHNLLIVQLNHHVFGTQTKALLDAAQPLAATAHSILPVLI
jgi:hypothetical protein